MFTITPALAVLEGLGHGHGRGGAGHDVEGAHHVEVLDELERAQVVGRVVAVDDPAHPSRARTVDGDAQLAALGGLVDGALAVVGVGDVAGDVLALAPRSPATFLAPSSLRSKIVHRTPRDESVRAVPSPSPDAPPVMTAEMPLRSMRRMLRALPHRPPSPHSPAADVRAGRRATSGHEVVPGHAVLGRGGLHGQDVDPVVHLVPGVALHPGEAHRPAGVERQAPAAAPTGPGWRRACRPCCATPGASSPPTTGRGSN